MAGQREDAISLYLVAIGGSKVEPDAGDEESALATAPLKSTISLEAVNVKRGCYLLAKCTGVAGWYAIVPQIAHENCERGCLGLSDAFRKRFDAQQLH